MNSHISALLFFILVSQMSCEKLDEGGSVLSGSSSSSSGGASNSESSSSSSSSSGSGAVASTLKQNCIDDGTGYANNIVFSGFRTGVLSQTDPVCGGYFIASSDGTGTMTLSYTIDQADTRYTLLIFVASIPKEGATGPNFLADLYVSDDFYGLHWGTVGACTLTLSKFDLLKSTAGVAVQYLIEITDFLCTSTLASDTAVNASSVTDLTVNASSAATFRGIVGRAEL